MRNRWKSYDAYHCAHSICVAHLLRDCTSVWEQEQQTWAAEMHELLVSMAVAADEWRQRCLPRSGTPGWPSISSCWVAALPHSPCPKPSRSPNAVGEASRVRPRICSMTC